MCRTYPRLVPKCTPCGTDYNCGWHRCSARKPTIPSIVVLRSIRSSRSLVARRARPRFANFAKRNDNPPKDLKSTHGLWQPTRVAGATPEKRKEHPNLRILPFPKKWQDAVWILRYAVGRVLSQRAQAKVVKYREGYAAPGLRHTFLPAIVLKIQREPKRIAKKNGARAAGSIFSVNLRPS